MPSLCWAWRWDTVILAPEAASRPFSPSFESHHSTGPATPLIASQPQVTCPVPQHRPAFHPADCSSRFRDPSHSLASHFLGLQPSSLVLPASATLTGCTLGLALVPGENSGVRLFPPLLSFQRSASRSPWPGTPSVHRPSPPPPRPPRQLGLPGGLTHLLPALAPLRRCAHLAKPCLHPPLASSHPPLPQALSCSGGQASLAGSTRCTLSPAGGLRFPASLPPSALASILHSGSFPSAYKWEFFPRPCPCLWSCRRFVYGLRLWCFSPGFLLLAPCSGSRPYLSISSRSSVTFTLPNPVASCY